MMPAQRFFSSSSEDEAASLSDAEDGASSQSHFKPPRRNQKSSPNSVQLEDIPGMIESGELDALDDFQFMVQL